MNFENKGRYRILHVADCDGEVGRLTVCAFTSTRDDESFSALVTSGGSVVGLTKEQTRDFAKALLKETEL